MSLSAAEIWTRLLDRARLEIPEQTFRTWLKETKALEVKGHTLTVGTPDRFSADWNESKHAALLSGLAPVALGHPMTVMFKVHEEQKQRPQMDLFVAPPPTPAAPAEGKGKGTGSTTGNSGTGTGGVGSSSQLSARYTFDNFVIGKSNDLAAATAQAVAAAPGKAYNPFFIYGDTGLGKTHLMQAVAHEIIRATPRTRLMYIGTEQFTNELVGSIQGRTQAEFRRRFRELDLLLVDDVHFLRGKESTQEEFFNTFNALYESGRQIILTSDRPPKEIPGLEARLVSRFEWGMVADVELPDFEHRIAILQNKARLDHLERTIPLDVIRFIAEHVRSSVRELEGSVIRLLAFASLRRKEVSVDLAREALRDKLRGDGEPDSEALSVSTIQQAVAKAWGVSSEALRSKGRTKALTVPRQVAMHLIRELLGVQLVEIGNAFGGRDHSTVIHSLEKTETAMQADPEFAARVGKLRVALEGLRS
ncbi:MAG: chromosomal replication initiator protein DnaA [Gemmatimonadaceae bacterium]